MSKLLKKRPRLLFDPYDALRLVAGTMLNVVHRSFIPRDSPLDEALGRSTSSRVGIGQHTRITMCCSLKSIQENPRDGSPSNNFPRDMQVGYKPTPVHAKKNRVSKLAGIAGRCGRIIPQQQRLRDRFGCDH